jgi:type IV pilus assembly protein PilA
VVIIIGLLAAIAIPAFMGQRDKANDAVAKSLVRNAATAVESAFVDTQAYNATNFDQAIEAIEPNIEVVTSGAANASDDTVLYTSSSADSYVISSTSNSGAVYTLTKAADGTVTRTSTQPDGADADTDPDAGPDW